MSDGADEGMSTEAMQAVLDDLKRQLQLQGVERHQANKSIVDTLSAINARAEQSARTTEHQLEQIGSSVRRLELAVAGDESMGHRGLVSRMEAVERISTANQAELRMSRRIGAVIMALLAMLGAIVAWVLNVIGFFRKDAG